jgi:hypothetical protein
MTKTKTVNLNIPFAGFYCSIYSDEIDQTETQEAEHMEEREQEEQHCEDLRLSASEFCDILLNVSDYGAMQNAIARKYVSAFNNEASEALGFPLRLSFETMTSPREYNFATDRIFCDMPASVARKLFVMSKRENHAALTRVIKSRFTSCDGFISHYSNRLADWTDKPLADWDHNELGTLLIACLSLCADWKDNDWELSVYYAVTDCDGIYREWQDGIDWQKFETAVSELRAEKLAEWQEENPDAELPYRCDLTPDMFTGKRGIDLR